MGSNFVSAITSHNDALGFQQLGLETKNKALYLIKQDNLMASKKKLLAIRNLMLKNLTKK